MGLRQWIARHSTPSGAEFEPEGLLHCESVRGSVTYRDYHRPGKRTSLEKFASACLIAVTRRRLVVRTGNRTQVDLAWTDPRNVLVVLRVDGDRLLIQFDAAVSDADSGGTVEIRARCADPGAVLALIENCRQGRLP